MRTQISAEALKNVFGVSAFRGRAQQEFTKARLQRNPQMLDELHTGGADFKCIAELAGERGKCTSRP